MDEEINIEIDICGNNLNDEFANETEKEKNIDSQNAPEEKASNYLTASELFVLRKDICKIKGKDEDIELSRGPKLYAPSESLCEKEKMSDLLQNQKKSLSLQRGAKIRDCMKAEWIDELKVATVPSLKGKSTQHMGRNMKGKIALSPEEAVFLLEKSCIEIKRGNMPLSVEEAYAVMLKGKLGIEKYQVYSFLSQQGFIVVQHQSRIGPSYEQLMNLSKKKQKKRKAAVNSSDEPQEKRLTFSGVLASSSEINSSVNAENILSSDCNVLNSHESPVKVISQGALNNEQNIHIDNALHRNKKLDSVESEGITVSPDSTNRIDSNDITEKDASLSDLKEVTCDDNVKVVNEPVGSLESCVDNVKIVNEPVGSLESCVDNVKIVNEPVGSLESCVDNVKVGNEPVDSLESQKPNFANNENSVSGIKPSEKEITDAANDKEQNSFKEIDNDNINDIEIDYASIDTNEVTINKLDNREDINVEDVLSDIDNEEYVSSDSVPVVCDESSEDQSLDVLSCSTSDQQSLFDDFNSPSNTMYGGFPKEHDDEVTLVEVKIKENKPLAVIDLLSDEEQDDPMNDEESFEGSDDEIQVVKVCPVTTLNKGQANSRPVRSVKSECKKENIPVNIKSSYQQKMKFPELFRKDILCLPCPPMNLLPNHVQPAKEAYVINRRKRSQSSQSSQPNRGRVWNSFRELQDYQRERRINSGRPLKSFKEFRYHNEAFQNRNSSFNTQENSRDIGYDRNNQNSRDLGYNRNNNRNNPFIAQENSRDIGFDRNNQNSRDIGYDRSNPNPRDLGYDRNNSNPREMEDRKNPNLRNMEYDRNNSNPREMEYDRNNQNPRDMGFDRSSQNFSPQPDRSFNSSFLPFNHQERNISLPSVGAAFNPTNQMPFMNIPNLQNLSASNPVAFVNEIQKTVYSVASSMLSSMLGSHLTPPARSSPTFNEPPMMGLPHHQYNNFSSTPVIPNRMALNANIRTDFHPMSLPPDPMFSGERYPFSATMEPMLDNSWRPNNFRRRNFQQGPMFPCPYREGGKKRSWNDVKASVDGASTNASDSGSDIEEIPINLNQILWSNDIQPLVKPGTKLPVSQVFKSLRITRMANLLDRRYPNDRYLPATSSLEISFDVYLPGSKYKKTAPVVPNHRIIVLRSGDPIPKYSEIVVLQKKWNDKALLQIAVVDHGDVTFFSFNSINVPEMVPHKS